MIHAVANSRFIDQRCRRLREVACMLVLGACISIPIAAATAQGIEPRQQDRAVLNQQEAAKLGLRYLAFAEAAYNPGEKNNIEGFDYVETLEDFILREIDNSSRTIRDINSSGLKGAVYRKNNRFIITFAGVEDNRDVITSAINTVIPLTTQYKLAAAVGRVAGRMTQDVVFVGHSLGGGLAQEAAFQSGRRGIGFNTAGSGLVRRISRGNFGDNYISFNVGRDFAVNSGRQHGTEYIFPGGVVSGHGVFPLRDILQAHADQAPPPGRATNWARVNMARSNAYALVTNNISAVGNANSGRVSPPPAPDLIAEDLFVTQDVVKAETQFRLVEGDPDIHLHEHGSTIGTLHSPGGTPIYSVNNAGRGETIVEKDFVLAAGTRRFFLSGLGSFITTEYPEFVGSRFNDRGEIVLSTAAGGRSWVYERFNESVNSSSFSPIANLPFPLRKETGEATGGTTGFIPIQSESSIFWPFRRPSIDVPAGGTVTLRFTVTNVGDTLYPSAIAVTDLRAE